MGRLPKIRVSYHNDAMFLMRLIQAIERDTSRPIAWRRSVIEDLQRLADKFMKAPSCDVPVADPNDVSVTKSATPSTSRKRKAA